MCIAAENVQATVNQVVKCVRIPLTHNVVVTALHTARLGAHVAGRRARCSLGNGDFCNENASEAVVVCVHAERIGNIIIGSLAGRACLE